MPTVTVQPEGVRVNVEEGTNLLAALGEVGLNIESVCGGRGICRKCIVEVLSGALSERTSAEIELERAPKNWRLACQTRVVGDVVVSVPQSSRQTRGKILEWGLIGGFDFYPVVRCVNVELESPSLKDQKSDLERLLQVLKVRSIDHFLLKRLQTKLRDLDWKIEAILYDGEVLDVRPQNNRDVYGIAVDVGTTTVVVYLVNLKTGRIVATKSDYNGQIIHGDDVISRMNYALNNYDNLVELQSRILATINKLVQDAVKDASCSLSDVYVASFAGNTVMTSFLCGVETSAIASAPYVPPFRSSLRFKARELGLELNSSAVAYTLPLISGYVGGDVVADILISGMHKKDEDSLLIDLGTNGEVVLKSGDRMLAASTAAGPALEGAGLSNGMRGMEGAIESVSIDTKTYNVYYRTIGEKAPRGICGSGVVDSIAWMLISGVLDRRGRMANPDLPRIIIVNGERAFVLADGEVGRKIYITQSDVRRFQLAKAAIFSACLLLLKIAGLKAHELSRIYIAGAFGNYIDSRSAMTVGMIPELPSSKMVQIGNGSGHGAVMSMISKNAKEEVEMIARSTTAIDLNTIKDFQSEFIDATHFPHRRVELFPNVIRAIQERIPPML
ncbi:MAG: ASKHA domain-containing protein [Candidatus Bathyarchaeia archaeon]